MSPLATYLVETFVTLAAVIVVAILVLLGAKRLGIGRPLGPMRLVGRMPLDARRAVYLVQVANQVLILGASEAGITKLGELHERDLGPSGDPEPRPRFSDLLASLRGKPASPRDVSATTPTPKEEGHG
jgi:flagellar biogenesis protein FliO